MKLLTKNEVMELLNNLKRDLRLKTGKSRKLKEFVRYEVVDDDYLHPKNRAPKQEITIFTVAELTEEQYTILANYGYIRSSLILKMPKEWHMAREFSFIKHYKTTFPLIDEIECDINIQSFNWLLNKANNDNSEWASVNLIQFHITYIIESLTRLHKFKEQFNRCPILK